MTKDIPKMVPSAEERANEIFSSIRDIFVSKATAKACGEVLAERAFRDGALAERARLLTALRAINPEEIERAANYMMPLRSVEIIRDVLVVLLEKHG